MTPSEFLEDINNSLRKIFSAYNIVYQKNPDILKNENLTAFINASDDWLGYLKNKSQINSETFKDLMEPARNAINQILQVEKAPLINEEDFQKADFAMKIVLLKRILMTAVKTDEETDFRLNACHHFIHLKKMLDKELIERTTEALIKLEFPTLSTIEGCALLQYAGKNLPVPMLAKILPFKPPAAEPVEPGLR